MQKSGLTIEEDVMKLLASDDQDSVDRLFLRIERYMKILCNQKFLDDLTENQHNVFENI